jgi:hypothetical protein
MKKIAIVLFLVLLIGALSSIGVAAKDTDGDGLTDHEEKKTYFTNHLEPDSDFDGLNDYEEVITYGTDPWDEDTDDGGVWDGEEVYFCGPGFDPLNPNDDQFC